MTNVNKSKKHLSPTPPFFPGSTSLPDLPPPPPEQCRGLGNGGCSQFRMLGLCCSFLLTLLSCSSVGALPQETVLHNLSNVSPSHRLQLFTNCPSVAPFHGVPSCPPGTGCSSVGPPRGHKPCQQTCSGMGSPEWAASRYLLHRGPPCAAGAQPASPWSCPWVAGEPLRWRLEHLLSLLLH